VAAQPYGFEDVSPVDPARLSRVVSIATATGAALLLVLGVLYLIVPPRSIPALIPMFTPAIADGHRYRQAVSAFTFSGILGYLSLLRWRLHAQHRRG
jgi:hypothetical protein